MTKFESDTDSGYVCVSDKLWIWIAEIKQNKQNSTAEVKADSIQEDLPNPEGSQGGNVQAQDQGCSDHPTPPVASGGGQIFLGNISAVKVVFAGGEETGEEAAGAWLVVDEGVQADHVVYG